MSKNETFSDELVNDFLDLYKSKDKITSDLLESQPCKILNFVFNNPSFTTIKKNLLETICKNPKILFDHEEYSILDKDELNLVIEHDNLDMKENDIFNYIIKWSTNKDEKVLHNLIKHIRFYQFSLSEFTNVVWKYQNLLSNELI
ncbi:4960_t:CDS:2 [Cetraspora pellucida]|uniref:4960_t:CDS:1 n=1 Tax=Cetraspora pellucida TaxID=1433469 RepID=A0A9N9JXW8_9GLOM|nr:4960_t:CDS:2 [Cetraspora pellucida]